MNLRLVSKQWKRCKIGEKVVYPIAKNRTVGVTRMTDSNYGPDSSDSNLNLRCDDFSLWTLSQNDYIFAIDRRSNNTKYLTASEGDYEYFCFICY